MNITVLEGDSVAGSDLSLDALKKYGAVTFLGAPLREELPVLLRDSDAVLCSKTVMDRALLKALPRLSYIGLTATGYNNIDLAAAKDCKITVTNVPAYSSDAVAQLTIAFLLQFAENLIAYATFTKDGLWTKTPLFCAKPLAMTELCGKTLGLLGMGSIGKKVAKIASALGMRVIYHARSEKKDLPYRFVSQNTLWAESDFLSLHCPLTAENRGIIGKETLARMKKGAFLINTARGGLIDETAVADALRDGTLAGFAADVLTLEPQAKDSPFLGLENCILTPHIAWAPLETRERLWREVLLNLDAYLAGEKRNVVSLS